MAMFEYATSNETGRLLHIGDVVRGKECNCICPGCGDQMVAKQGKIKEHHFAHATSEKKSCYMTMVHRFFQEYLYEQKFLDIAAIKLSVLDNVIEIPCRKVKILNAQLEATIGNYRADVLLLTNIGKIAIEIFVTNKSKDEKINFYKKNNIAAIEYDFSGYRNKTIEEAKNAFEIGRIRMDVFRYPQYEYYLSKIKKENEYLHRVIKNRVYHVSSLSENYLYVPKFKHLLSVNYENKYHELNLTFVKECFIKFDGVNPGQYNNIYYINYVRKNCFLKVIYLPEGSTLPEEFQRRSYSLLIKHISYSDRFSEISSWSYYAPLDKRLKELNDEIYNYFSYIKKIEDYVFELSKQYLQFNNEEAYGIFYRKWRLWLIKNKLIDSNIGYKIKIPSLLRCFKNSSSFWMFEAWSVFILTNLIEIIDGFDIDECVSYFDVFNKLTNRFYLTKDAHDFFNLKINSEYVSKGKSHLILIPHIIQKMISNFINCGHIKAYDNHLVKKENLLDLLAIELVKINSTIIC
ncbi:MAG: hypothetical protein RR510_05155 [Morganella sp. (in: enterobacteria)]